MVYHPAPSRIQPPERARARHRVSAEKASIESEPRAQNISAGKPPNWDRLKAAKEIRSETRDLNSNGKIEFKMFRGNKKPLNAYKLKFESSVDKLRDVRAHHVVNTIACAMVAILF